ncbi:S8 family serine peptidase [Nonomuraea sp. NPDC048916]|uniref:S8 family serine peptidase n=1 Tax=Nonomuraea sp. NPDC048916 TaxID=3154232 RepID=UPI0033E43F23
MPRRFGLPSVYLAAAVATAMTTAAPMAMTPASGLAARPAVSEPARPYLVTARDRAGARDLVGEVRWRVRRYYTAALPGFATWLTSAEAAELRTDPRVRAVEPDRRIHPMTSPRPRPAAEQGATGAGTTVYVVDSGLDPGRAEFGDRAWRAFDATGGTGDDCTGHGTQVSRQVAEPAHGARLASVRVLGCDGTGTLSDVVAGLDWVRRHARRPAVANLSIDGAGSPAYATAVRRLVRSGVFVTGASDTGGCQMDRNGQALTAAAPQLAGLAARYLELHPAAGPLALASYLKCTAADGTVRQNPSGAPRNGGR